MKLYFSPGACSLAPHIVASEAGVPIELERVDLKSKTIRKSGADFSQISATAMVPVLELDDGDILTEVAAVVLYVADQNPGSKLAPPCGSRERYHVQKWLNFIATEIHKMFTPLFKPDTPEAYKAIAKDNLAKAFTLLDQRLADRPYLMGAQFTAADAYLFTVVSWSRLQQIELDRWPHLKACWERIRARPKVEDAMKAEGLIKVAA